MKLDLTPALPCASLAEAARAWQTRVPFEIFHGRAITRDSPMPHGITRARVWSLGKFLGEIQLH